MVWYHSELKFKSPTQKWPKGIEEGLAIRAFARLRHTAYPDYERHVSFSTDRSDKDYILEIERIETKGAGKPEGTGPNTIQVTLSYSGEGDYQSVIKRIEENAKKLGLEQVVEAHE